MKGNPCAGNRQRYRVRFLFTGYFERHRCLGAHTNFAQAGIPEPRGSSVIDPLARAAHARTGSQNVSTASMDDYAIRETADGVAWREADPIARWAAGMRPLRPQPDR